MSLQETLQSYYSSLHTPRNTISLSLVGHCRRELAYRVHGHTQALPSGKTLSAFDDGNMIHFWWRKTLKAALDALKSCYSLVNEEQEVRAIGLVGHIDGLLSHNPWKCSGKNWVSDDPVCPGEDLVLELKSTNYRNYNRIKKEGITPYYEAQIQSYLGASGNKKALFVVKNKDNGDLHSCLVDYNPVVFSHYESKIKEILSSRKAEDIGKDFSLTEEGELVWQCKACPFNSECWKGST